MRLKFLYFLAILVVAVAARGKRNQIHGAYTTIAGAPGSWSGLQWGNSGYYPSSVNYGASGVGRVYNSGYGRGSSWNSAGTGYDSALYNGGKWQAQDGTYSGYGGGGLDYYLNWRKNGFVTANHHVKPYVGASLYTGGNYATNTGKLAGSGWSGYQAESGGLANRWAGSGYYGAGAGSGNGYSAIGLAGGIGKGAGLANQWAGSGYYAGAGNANGYSTSGLAGGAGNGYSTVLGGVFGVRDRLNYGGHWGSGASYGNYGRGVGWNTGSFYAPAGVKPMYSGVSAAYGQRQVGVGAAQLGQPNLPAISGLYNDGRWSNRGVYSGYGDGLDGYWQWRNNGFKAAGNAPIGVYNGYSTGSWSNYGGSRGNSLNTADRFGYLAGSGAATGAYNGFGLGSGIRYNSGTGYQTSFGTGAESAAIGSGTGSYVYSKLNTADVPAVGPTVFNVYGTRLAGTTVPAVGAGAYGAYVLSRYQNRPYSTSGIIPMYSQNKWNAGYGASKTGYYAGYGQNSGALYSPTSYRPNYYSTVTGARPSYISVQSGSSQLSPAIFPSTTGIIGSGGFSSNLYNDARWSNKGVYSGYGNGLHDYWNWRKNGFQSAGGAASIGTGAAYTNVYNKGYSGLAAAATLANAGSLNLAGNSYLAGATKHTTVNRPYSGYVAAGYSDRYDGIRRPATYSQTAAYNSFTSPSVATSVFGIAGIRPVGSVAPAVATITSTPLANSGAYGTTYSLGNRFQSRPYQYTSGIVPMYTQNKWSTGDGYYTGYGQGIGTRYSSSAHIPSYAAVLTGISQQTPSKQSNSAVFLNRATAGSANYYSNLYNNNKWSNRGIYSGYGDRSNYYSNRNYNGFLGTATVPSTTYAGYTNRYQKPYVALTGSVTGAVPTAGYTSGSWNRYDTSYRPGYSGIASSIYSLNSGAAKFPYVSPTKGILGVGSPAYSAGYNLGVTPSIASSVNSLAESSVPLVGSSLYGKYVSTNYQNRPYSTSGISPMYSQSKWSSGNSGLGAGYYAGYGQNSGAYYGASQYRPYYTGSKYSTAISGAAQISPATFPSKIGNYGLYSGDKWNNNGVYSGYGNGLDFYWNWRKGGFVGEKHSPAAVYNGYKGSSLNNYNAFTGAASSSGIAAAQGSYVPSLSWSGAAPAALATGASSIYGYGGRWTGRPSYAGANSIYNANKWTVNNRGGQDSGLYYGYGHQAQSPYYGQAGIYSGAAQLSPAIHPSGSASFLTSGNMGSLYNNGQWRNSGVYSGYGTNLNNYRRWGTNALASNGAYYGGTKYVGPYTSNYYSLNGDYSQDGSYVAKQGLAGSWNGGRGSSWQWGNALGASPIKSSQWSWGSGPSSWTQKTYTSTPWRSPSSSHSYSWK